MNETEGWVRQHWLLSILICWLMAGVIGTIAVWIYTGDVYLEIRPPAFSFSGWGIWIALVALFFWSRSGRRGARNNH